MAMFAAQLAYQTVKVEEAGLKRAARHVLHLDASHGPNSVIGQGAQAFFNELSIACPSLQVQHLRLWEDGTRKRLDYSLRHVEAKMAMLGGAGGQQERTLFAPIEELALQLASARGLVVSVPMWNYGVPYIVKQYFDCVMHPGLTFRELPSGGTAALLGGGRPLLILTSSGGSGSRDHLTPWLCEISALAGFDADGLLSAANVAHGDRSALVERFRRDAAVEARRFAEALSREVPAQAAAGQPAAAAAAAAADDDRLDCQDGLVGWLRTQGGLSTDCLQGLEAMSQLTGALFLEIQESEWRENEELGLSEEDVQRLVDLQQRFSESIGSVGLGPSSDR